MPVPMLIEKKAGGRFKQACIERAVTDDVDFSTEPATEAFSRSQTGSMCGVNAVDRDDATDILRLLLSVTSWTPADSAKGVLADSSGVRTTGDDILW